MIAKSAPQGIDDNRHDNRCRFRRLESSLGRCSTHCHDDVRLEANEISRECRVPVVLALGPARLEGDVLTLDIAQVAQALAERLEAAQPKVGRGARRYVTHPGQLLRGLSDDRAEWRKGNAESENDREPDPPHAHLDWQMAGGESSSGDSQELAALVEHGYSITSSARPSTDGGIVSLSAFAVLRLMTSSNLLGCSTGRSPGLAPFRILST